MIQRKQPNPASADDRQSNTAIYGLRPVMEAIESGVRIDRVLIQNGLTGTLATQLKGRVRDNGIPFQFVPEEKLNRLSKGNHQGVVALISPIPFHDAMELIPSLMESGKTPLVLLLDHITDVRNFGAIVRTAECAGVDAVVVPDHGSAQIGNDAVKTSSGALLRVPVCRESNLKLCSIWLANAACRWWRLRRKGLLITWRLTLHNPHCLSWEPRKRASAPSCSSFPTSAPNCPSWGRCNP